MEYELPALWVNIAVAVGTLAAAVVPFVLFLLERKDRKRAQAALAQERQERLDEERRRTEEARVVDVRKVLVEREVYVRDRSTRGEDGKPSGRSLARPTLRVVVYNNSPSVIFDVRACADAPNAQKAISPKLLPAGASMGHTSPSFPRPDEQPRERIADGMAYGDVFLGREHEVPTARWGGVDAAAMPEGWRDELPQRVWVEFTDVAARRWARYEDGEVKRLPAVAASEPRKR